MYVNQIHVGYRFVQNGLSGLDSIACNGFRLKEPQNGYIQKQLKIVIRTISLLYLQGVWKFSPYLLKSETEETFANVFLMPAVCC